ncbi:DnaJ-class molecular chaperone [Nocardiopsis aegyptia]|uniref:DnaJ-class molecular chaperone n=1 Tax=Nocardiopsis aegyptia TaxID=220378 RepID=A0A7Z0JCY8_9ACTN|nr:DnaJ-class molecular chaperone [Nocardiopsis aegyptia]
MTASLLCATCYGHGVLSEGDTCTDCSGFGLTAD